MIEEQVERIRAQVGHARVLCALSGGVDSAVAALLVHKAVGDQLTCVFVDHGMMRKDEALQVVEDVRAAISTSRSCTWPPRSASSPACPAGVTDPEMKRK